MRDVSRTSLFAFRCALMTLMTVLAVAAFTTTAAAAEIDLATEVLSAPAQAEPGEVATYTIEYSNGSATDSENARVRLILPTGVFLDWTLQQRAAVEATVTDTLGNVGVVELYDVTCQHMLVSIKGSGGSPPSLPAGTSGEFSVEIPLPDEIPTVGVFTVQSPEPVAGDYDFALGECADCGTLSSCFGGPLSEIAAVTADLELVNDPAGADPSQGCGALEGFTAGNIALVRRGGCQFGTKALNAENAGAAGVVIVNNQPGQNIHSLAMPPGDDGDQVTVPVIMVGYEDGEQLIDAVQAKAQVSATLGGVETEDLPFVSCAFHAPNTDTDPDGTNDCEHVITNVDYLQNNPPDASFTYTPSNPVWGQLIQFTDTSSNAPTSWSWDFGDGVGSSQEQNPTYTYTQFGTFQVGLTATNEFGSGSTTVPVSVGALIPNGHFYFIPAAAFGPGAEGSFFVTDVEVSNVGQTSMTYQFAWLPRGQDNSSATLSQAYMLAANTTVRYPNILDELFGLEDVAGAVAVVADSEHVLLMSRTYNQPEDQEAGTFGQGLPGIAQTDMTPAGVRQRILFMTENEGFRANLGCQNGTPAPLRVTAELFRADGTLLETRTIDLLPWSNLQVNRIFGPHSPVDAGFVDVWSTTSGAAFYCYGSVGDNRSNDPTTILPQ